MTTVYVVTGGGSGIGKAIATMLPKEDTVVITGRSKAKLDTVADALNATGAHVITAACDVSDRASVRALAEFAAGLGDVKKVFNCAGVSGSMGTPETITKINALGTVYVNQEFYKVMDGGVICDIASDSGYMLPKFMLPNEKTYALVLQDEAAFVAKCVKKACILKKDVADRNFAYMISKNFVRWFSMKCAFKYMTNKGIRVFSVSPGFVKTPMTDAEAGEATETMLGYSGVGRGAEPEELAFLVTALADERCGYFMGADVVCDAGCINNGYGLTTSRKPYDRACLNEAW